MKPQLRRNEPGRAQHYFESKLEFELGPDDLWLAMDQSDPCRIIDVRAREHFDEGHLPGAIHLPESDWESLRGLSADRVNVIYSDQPHCHLAARAAAYFASRGFSVMELEGGFAAWKERGHPVVSELSGDIERAAA